MKRIIICLGGLILACAATATVYAGGIDNKTNWSAEWVRTLNRNAATDYADIAMYNPAGTVKLNEGFTLNGSLQYGKKEYANNISLPAVIPYSGCTECESDEPSYIPGIFGVYNRGKWSLFGALSNVAGGGKVDFNQGNWTTLGAQLSLIGASDVDNLVIPGPLQQISGESFYLGYTLGAAYALNDMFSFAVGLRYVDANREATGSATILDGTGSPSLALAINYEEEGEGFGGIFGVNIAPNDRLNLGMRFETETDIDLEAKVKEEFPPNLLQNFDPPIINGQERSRNLPATLGLGASYRITPKLRTEVNLTYYFNEDADWDGHEDDAENGYDVGIAFEYLFNDKLKGSIGYMYTKYGHDPEHMLPENPELDVNTIGGGIAYAITEKFHTNFSIANSFYIDDSYSPSPGFTVEFEKNILFVAFGVEYRFL